MKPARQRKLAGEILGSWGLSLRRTCGLLLLNRTTYYYRHRRQDNLALRMRVKELAAARIRFGYRRLHVLLRREGWGINHKRVYRIYCEEGLAVRTKKRKKIASKARAPLQAVQRANQQWSMDFVADRLEDGRRFRVLTVVDNFSRECLSLEAGTSLTGRMVAACLERVAGRRVSGHSKPATRERIKTSHFETPISWVECLLEKGGSTHGEFHRSGCNELDHSALRTGLVEETDCPGAWS